MSQILRLKESLSFAYRLPNEAHLPLRQEGGCNWGSNVRVWVEWTPQESRKEALLPWREFQNQIKKTLSALDHAFLNELEGFKDKLPTWENQGLYIRSLLMKENFKDWNLHGVQLEQIESHPWSVRVEVSSAQVEVSKVERFQAGLKSKTSLGSGYLGLDCKLQLSLGGEFDSQRGILEARENYFEKLDFLSEKLKNQGDPFFERDQKESFLNDVAHLFFSHWKELSRLRFEEFGTERAWTFSAEAF